MTATGINNHLVKLYFTVALTKITGHILQINVKIAQAFIRVSELPKAHVISVKLMLKLPV